MSASSLISFFKSIKANSAVPGPTSMFQLEIILPLDKISPVALIPPIVTKFSQPTKKVLSASAFTKSPIMCVLYFPDISFAKP